MASIITHSQVPGTIHHAVDALSEAIIKRGNQKTSTVDEQLSILEHLTTFALGRFLILNRGFNAYWTNYIISYPQWGPQLEADSAKPSLCPLEKEMLETFTTIRATQERFKIFKKQLQEEVNRFATLKNTIDLASIPCGLMVDLIELDYSRIRQAKCFGIDLDIRALTSSQEYLKKHTSLSPKVVVDYFQESAWDLSFHDAFDIITSNGLNIYESDDQRVIQLYRRFYRALKSGGVLVTSFLTPEYGTPECPWDMGVVDLTAYKRQSLVFKDILNVKWQCFRTEEVALAQLRAAGFCDIRLIWDSQKVFPSVLAYKA